jgi:hypothetical protein
MQVGMLGRVLEKGEVELARDALLQGLLPVEDGQRDLGLGEHLLEFPQELGQHVDADGVRGAEDELAHIS